MDIVTLRQQLGQMFLVGIDGSELRHNSALLHLLEEDQPGGVLLFDRDMEGRRRNIVNPRQLQRLCRAMQERSDQTLLIAVDQEGGRVCRLKTGDGFPPTRAAAELGAEDDTSSTAAAAGRMAATLAEMGITWNLAPVVDLASNPDNPVIARLGRSFNADPARVVRHAAAVIKAHHHHGIACCLKHFPGHGSSAGDSHLGLVDVSSSWQEQELLPFRQLAEAGLADAIMTAHVFQRALDSRLPATLSPAILQDLLRRHLAFAGVIISDDLQMRAIAEHWTLEEAVGLAVVAGADMLVIGNQLASDPLALSRGIEAIVRLLDQGLVAPSRLKDSLQRIARLKQSITEAGRICASVHSNRIQ